MYSTVSRNVKNIITNYYTNRAHKQATKDVLFIISHQQAPSQSLRVGVGVAEKKFCRHGESGGVGSGAKPGKSRDFRVTCTKICTTAEHYRIHSINDDILI